MKLVATHMVVLARVCSHQLNIYNLLFFLKKNVFVDFREIKGEKERNIGVGEKY